MLGTRSSSLSAPRRRRHTTLGRLVAGVALALALGVPVAASVDFEAPPSFDFGSGLQPVAFVDWDEDGHLDAVATRSCSSPPCSNALAIFRGDGSGAFGAMIAAYPGAFFDAVAEDFDQDGHVDLAVTRAAGGIQLVRGDGTGGLTSPTTVTTSMVRFPVAADVDADGWPDLVATGGEAVRLYLGDGAGGFVASSPVSVLGAAGRPALGDFNQDGQLDVGVLFFEDCGHFGCTRVGAAALLGNGAGGLTFPVYLETDWYPQDVACVDVDEDGDSDLAVSVSNSSTNEIDLFLSQGNGSFSFGGALSPGFFPGALVKADFDADGHADLATLTSKTSGPYTTQITVLLGTGSGSFVSAGHAETSGVRLLPADLDEDGRLDLVATGSGTSCVHLGDGRGSFARTPSVGTGSSPFLSAAADFVEDGFVDLVVGNRSGSARTLSVLASDRAGEFSNVGTLDGRLLSSVAADYDEDGHLDVACGAPSSPSPLFGDGLGDFRTTPAPGSPRVIQPRIDFDEDGHEDLLVSSEGAVRVFLGHGDGTFGPRVTLTTYPGAGDYVAADFNEDGHLDLAGVNVGENSNPIARFSILFGDGNGSFTLPLFAWIVEASPTRLIAADFDADGHVDVAIANRGACCGFADGGLTLILGNGDGTMRPPVRLLTGLARTSVAAADIDGDGRLDLVAEADRRAEVSVVLGDGAGSFGPPTSFVVGSDPTDIVADDLEHDGDVDLVVASACDQGVFVLRNDAVVPHLDCRRGNVNVAGGSVTDVLFVNGSAGSGRERRVIVDRAAPFEMHIDAPPSGEASFVLWEWRGTSTRTTVRLLPRGLGNIGMPTPLTPAVMPQPRLVANNVGIPDRLGVENWPGPQTMPAPTTLLDRPNGLPRTGTVYLQGIILDPMGPNGTSAVTNGIELVIR